ncbi:hypothetical protein BC567DRAFT_228787, partial [Phyllosticta citribraziliensis]
MGVERGTATRRGRSGERVASGDGDGDGQRHDCGGLKGAETEVRRRGDRRGQTRQGGRSRSGL